MHAVAPLEHLHHRVLGNLGVLDLVHSVVQIRVEGLAEGVDDLDPFAPQDVRDLFRDHLDTLEQVLKVAAADCVVDSAVEVVDDREEALDHAFTGTQGLVFGLSGLATAEVLELGLPPCSRLDRACGLFPGGDERHLEIGARGLSSQIGLALVVYRGMLARRLMTLHRLLLLVFVDDLEVRDFLVAVRLSGR